MGLLSFFHSVVCCVVMIYCIVIIYLPSMEEAETNFIVSIVFDIFYPEVFFIHSQKNNYLTSKLSYTNHHDHRGQSGVLQL